VRIATWNVNSMTVRLPRVTAWLAETAPDVVALQETKCADAAFPYAVLDDLGYQALHVGEGRWNGVAIVSRIGLSPVATELGGFSEARFARAQCGPLLVSSVYVPNGRALDDAQYPYKLRWLAALRETLDQVPAGAQQVVMGDFNVALTDSDVWDPGAFLGSTHVSPPERAALQALIDAGLTDVVARPGKGDHPFTYWDYRAGRFHQDLGMRIDYVLLSHGVAVRDAYVDRNARKGKLPSDHAPIVVDLDLGS
jgi:exodeoxyribonuclease III